MPRRGLPAKVVHSSPENDELEGMIIVLRKFASDRSGNFAIMSAILSVPLIMAAGLAVDYARYSASHRHLQELADITSLNLAASKELNEAKLRKMAEDTIEANRDRNRLRTVSIANLTTTADDVDIELRGEIPATLMAIAGYEELPSRASALAERAMRGHVEVALILDNTWSMSATDAKGVQKIATLKTAATKLVNELMPVEDGAVRIGLVPYADYVNVGTQYRNESWLDVPADYTTTPAPRTCEWKNVESTVCDKPNPPKTCTRVVDGIEETYSCSGGCADGYSRKVIEYKEVCSGGGKGTAYKWFGCVGSRMGSDYRLHDNNTGIKYPGYVETSHKCLNPIMTLGSKKAPLLQAINGMIINRGTSYRPNTYIPAGLIWGLNVLSPGIPFKDSGEYDNNNVKPRKVAVLMTDGENTLRYNAANGRHATLSGGAANQAKQIKQTNDDTVAICTYMKSKNIEIFTVAFMVDDPTAKSLLEGCATDSSHYYDATDSDALLAAFSGIGQSLRVVRLAR